MGLLSIFKKDLTKIKSADIAKDVADLEKQEQQFGRRLADKSEQLETLRLYYEQEKLSEGEIEQIASQRVSLKHEVAEITNHLNRIRDEKLTTIGLKYAAMRTENSQKSTLLGEISKLSDDERAKVLTKLGSADEKMVSTINSVRDIMGVPTSPKDIRRSFSPDMREELDNINSAQAKFS